MAENTMNDNSVNTATEARALPDDLVVLNHINQLARGFNSTLELKEIINYAIQALPQMLSAGKCSIFLYEQETEEMVMVAHNHKEAFYGNQDCELRISINEDQMLTRVIREGRSLLIKDIEKELGVKNRSKYASKSSMITMLKLRDQFLGVINVNDPIGRECFDDKDFTVLLNINEHLATAISNARLFAHTKMLAMTDGLTGLYVHRYFQEVLEKEVIRAERYQQPLTLLMIDIDHFKRVNDTYGHQTGDAVLKGISKILKQHLRRSDYACRYGGEEMALVLTQTSMDGANNTAERIRDKIQKETFVYDEKEIHVTVSIGVSEFAVGMNRPQLIELADKSLYEAKHSGRNRVCCMQAASQTCEKVEP